MHAVHDEADGILQDRDGGVEHEVTRQHEPRLYGRQRHGQLGHPQLPQQGEPRLPQRHPATDGANVGGEVEDVAAVVVGYWHRVQHQALGQNYGRDGGMDIVLTL